MNVPSSVGWYDPNASAPRPPRTRFLARQRSSPGNCLVADARGDVLNVGLRQKVAGRLLWRDVAGEFDHLDSKSNVSCWFRALWAPLPLASVALGAAGAVTPASTSCQDRTADR
jgi:hypothetical protein